MWNISSQVEWQQKGGTYWVRYVHVEIIGFVNSDASKNCQTTNIGVGDRVRVKAQISTPKYKWGSVTHRSVGVVIGMCFLLFIQFSFLSGNFTVANFLVYPGIESNGDITVNFPEQNRWTGLLSEMERVEPSESNVTANAPSPMLGSFDSATVAATLQGTCLLYF